MAGGFVDRTQYRIPYDIDGTSVIVFNNTNPATNNTVYGPSNGAIKGFNGELGVSGVVAFATYNAIGNVAFVFPQLMDVTGYRAWKTSDNAIYIGGQNQVIQYSLDTINGYDGTWTNTGQSTLATLPTAIRSEYRTDPINLSLNGIKGIRFAFSAASGNPYNAIHLYGKPTTPQIKYWHPTLDEELSPSYFDYGYAYRSSTDTKAFRIKNSSSTQVANTITISFDEAQAASPTLVSQYTIAKSDLVYGSSISITSLNPNSISEVLYSKRTMSATAAIGAYSLRVKAVVGSWTTP